MTQSPREIVQRCLNFKYPQRLPREMWILPGITHQYPEGVKELEGRFPSDFVWAEPAGDPSPKVKGDMFKIGTYVDRWGCEFTNIQNGVIGEVKNPMLKDLENWRNITPPYDTLPKNPEQARDRVNRFCPETDKYTRAAFNAHPWERYQFIRGTQDAMMDIMSPEKGAIQLLERIHEFYLKELEFWVTTDVDSIVFSDDWGAQKQLLIPPTVWRDIFKPMYKDYCDLTHTNGKTIFMHSDGCITEIYKDLIEIGVDALNSQLFCMDMAEIAKIAKGKITFWGEIDRQYVMISPNPQDGRDAVRKVAKHLYDPSGGIIAQFSLEPNANIDTAIAVFEEWSKLHQENK